MRIAIVTETFLPLTDGIVTRLCAAIVWLKSQGHEILVVAPDMGMNEFHGVKVAGIRARTFFLYKSRKLSLPSRKVRTYLMQFQPDIVHVVNPAVLGVAGVYYSKRLKLPLIASYHTNLPQYLEYYHLPFLKPAMWGFLRLLHNQADLNLCTSRTIQAELQKHKFRNVHLWNRGVDLDKFNPKHKDYSMRSFLTNGHPERKVMLYVGRLASEKNIESLKLVLDTMPDITLALVGDGPHRAFLEQYFSCVNAVFCGFMHGIELSKAYASADMFIFPSITETLGLVLMEAMAAGLPIVAAQSGPTCEQIENNVTGIIYNPHVPQDIVSAVVSLADERNRHNISAQALAYVQNYDWTGPSEQLYRMYCDVLRQSNGNNH